MIAPTAPLAHRCAAEHTVTDRFALSGDAEVVVTLTVRLETPGECCADIASTLAFSYEPPLPDDVAVRFDDRLYDGLYAGLAEAPGALPPAGLKAAVTEFRCEPALAEVVADGDWPRIGAITEWLATLSAAGVLAAWPAFQASQS